MKAFHFCRTVNGKPVLRDGTPAKRKGKTEIFDGNVKICKSGLHASEKAIDALSFAPGLYCRLVEIDVAEKQDDKVAGTKRKIIGEVEATKTVLKWCAEEAIHALETNAPNDEDSMAAATLVWLSAEFPGDVPPEELEEAAMQGRTKECLAN